MNDIIISGLNKSFTGHKVFENLDLTLKAEKVNCILGVSGSGKTTLLNILCGLTDFEGKIENLPEKKSYIFQNNRLIENLSVFGNVEYVLLDKSDKKARADLVFDLLKKVELIGRHDAKISELSGGMKKRVEIARAFAYPSELVLMDEPFSALDIGLKMRQMRVLADLLQNDKRTVVFVTHDIDEALLFSDRINILTKSGKLDTSFDIDVPFYERNLTSPLLVEMKSVIFNSLTAMS